MTTMERTTPGPIRAINRVGAFAARLGLEQSLDPDVLLSAAEKSTGLVDWGPATFREGLDRLLAALDGEANLTTIGRVAARTRVQGLLEVRLRLLDHRRRNAFVAEQQITRPIFVLGLPRTGTTVLYGLLAANPAMRSPDSWEVARPFPPASRFTRTTDPRVAQTEKEFQQFFKIAPGVDAIHPLGALLPQECMALQAPEFASYEFPTTFPIPSYFDWLKTQSLHEAYAFQKLFLQHMQSGYAGDHWILKTPAHLMWLETLLDVFPDVLLVHTHRDPTTVMASVSSLMYALRSSVADGVDPHEVGRDQLDAWTWGLERTMQTRAALPSDRVVDVMFTDTLNDPVGTVRKVYEHFDIEVTPVVEQGVRDYLAANPRDKHGTHTYDLADFGIDPDEANERFAIYRAHFNLA